MEPRPANWAGTGGDETSTSWASGFLEIYDLARLDSSSLMRPQGYENWEGSIFNDLGEARTVKNGLCSHLKALIACVIACVEFPLGTTKERAVKAPSRFTVLTLVPVSKPLLFFFAAGSSRCKSAKFPVVRAMPAPVWPHTVRMAANKKAHSEIVLMNSGRSNYNRQPPLSDIRRVSGAAVPNRSQFSKVHEELSDTYVQKGLCKSRPGRSLLTQAKHTPIRHFAAQKGLHFEPCSSLKTQTQNRRFSLVQNLWLVNTVLVDRPE